MFKNDNKGVKMNQIKTYDHAYPSFKDMFNLSDTSVSFIAGPCAIESESQLEHIAKALNKNHVKFIRGGAYKPRTSPYDFQGLGLEGLKLLRDVANRHSLYVVSEILDPRDVENGVKYTDIIQIGSRNMQNYSLLKEVGKTNHPILLKRGMMSTIQEFLYAAEYIASNGNCNIVMCERGIRTFETYTRNNLDITCITVIKNQTKLPIVVDVSHAAGRSDMVAPLVRCLYKMDIDGIMIEIHPEPSKSYSDAQQALGVNEFEDLLCSLEYAKVK